MERVMAKKEILHFCNQNVKRQGYNAIRHLYMELYEGEILGILMRGDIEKKALTQLITKEMKAFCIGDHPAIIKEMTVADNIFTVREGRGAKLYHKNHVYQDAETLLKEFQIEVRADGLMSDLQKTEIRNIELIKAYVQGYPIVMIQDLLMDYSITDQKEFLRVLKLLKEKKITFIIIEHNMDILLRLSDRILIFENGRIVKSFFQHEFPMCVKYFKKPDVPVKNGPLENEYEYECRNNNKTAVFEVNHLSGQFFEDLSFSVNKGETLSLLNLNKNARTELIYYLIGRKRIKNGSVLYKKEKYCPGSVRKMRNQRISIIRMQVDTDNYIFENLSTLENIYIGSIRKVSKRGILNKSLLNYVKKEFYSDIKDDENTLDTIAKWWIYLKRLELQNPRFLICEEIFAINDEYVDQMVRKFLKKMKVSGASILILSSSDRNLKEISDRVIEFGK